MVGANQERDIVVEVVTEGRLLSRRYMPYDVLLTDAVRGTGELMQFCGGKGKCGKCLIQASGALSPLCEAERNLLSQVQIADGWRLACQARARGDVCLTWDKVPTLDGSHMVIESPLPGVLVNDGAAFFRNWGAAVDLGTTTITAQLMNQTGVVVSAVQRNPQIAWGADVISRIEHALTGDAVKLADTVIEAILVMLRELAASQGIPLEEIDALVITGNTTMLHLLTGEDVAPLSAAPFAVRRLFGERISGRQLHPMLSPGTSVYLPPCISAFVGADISTAILACGLTRTASSAMLVDLGTNGEIALWHEGTLHCCSTAAGPAFEGYGISMGLYGVPGAIDQVWLSGGRIVATTIKGEKATGICGSGIVDALAVLLNSGILTETGAFTEKVQPPYVQLAEQCLRKQDKHRIFQLYEDISLTTRDIRNCQLAKGAIRAGIETLMHLAGLKLEDIDRVYLAGGFGRYLRLENAGRIGLLPQVFLGKTQVVGNAAQAGAAMLLGNQDLAEEIEYIARHAQPVRLDANHLFVDYYMEYMLFPESAPSV